MALVLASALWTFSCPDVVPLTQAKEKDSAARIKKFMTMMDSMTNKELDSSDIKLWQTESRIMRIARGAGVHPNYVGELIGWPTLLGPALLPLLLSPSCIQGALGDG